MHKSQVYSRLRALFQERQNHSVMQEKAWQESLYQEYEDLRQMDSSLRSMRYDLLLLKVQASDEKEVLELEEKIRAKEKEREAFYREHGIVEENFHHCKECKDTGKLDSKTVCPSCYPQSIRHVLGEYYPLCLADPKIQFSSIDFDLFSDESISIAGKEYIPSRAFAHYAKRLENFAKAFPREKKDFFLTGKTGTGKTYLAQALANALLDKGVLALYLPVMVWEEELTRLRVLQRSFRAEAEEIANAQSRIDLFLDCDFLIIDDLGRSSSSLQDPAAELYHLLEHRKKAQKPILFTSNLSIHQVAKLYDERIVSRLLERFEIFAFEGEDLRIAVRKREHA